VAQFRTVFYIEMQIGKGHVMEGDVSPSEAIQKFIAKLKDYRWTHDHLITLKAEFKEVRIS
jgi:hypothetical protein